MQVYGRLHSSTAQRATIIAGQTIAALVALWVLLLGGTDQLGGWFGLHSAAAPLFRRLLLFLLVIATYLRFTLMITVFLKRSVGWEEAISVCFAFLLYYVGFALLGGLKATPFGAVDVVALLLFLIGATINTLAESLRDRWRRDPANKGKLYTGGLFRYARHVNYFGDLVWVSGWALFTRNPWSAVIPVLLFCMFAFYNAPLLDNHLAEKHGPAFAEYRKRTKGLIPFVF